MDATGFNRDEIRPDMDLRRDLSIRSSRLPIIMDAAERHFGITIELEDFINVRTVRDIAQKISEIVAKKEGSSVRPSAKAAEAGVVRGETLMPLQDEATLKRLVFKSVPLELSASAPIKLSQGESVLFLSPDRDDAIAKNAGEIFRQDYGVDTIPMLLMQAKVAGQDAYDILTDEGSFKASQRISSLASLSGMVITLPKGWSGKIKGMADVSRLLRELLSPLQAFLRSPAKKFVVLIHCRDDAETLGRLPVEGMLGMFLSAAQEYSSVQFRTLEIDGADDLRAALGSALDRGYTPVEMIYCRGKVFTSEGYVAPSIFSNLSSLSLNPDDVVVMSGGASGITARLARCLVPFRPRIVFLGRTPAGPAANSAKTAPPQSSESSTPGSRASEIARTLADLHSSGIEAAYYPCDVTDLKAVRAVMSKVAKRYGKIDGIIHGAGVLRDGFLDQMTPDDFSMVGDVKFLGAWNLFAAAEKAGLRFFVGLSSVAAIQGNPGQTNYAAANRMMSALIRYLGRKNGAVRFKALMLPPVEGAGMAEDPEVREMLQRKGVGYIHLNELAGLFCRELFTASADDDWVMFMKCLPAVKTARINDTIRPLPDEELGGGTVAFRRENLPMIEGITSLDMRLGQLVAVRSFSLEKDLWLADHTPYKFVKYPLVSAAMILETFMEAARVLVPHLRVRGVRRMRFIDMILCPPGISRPCRISCRQADALPGEAMCEVSLSAQEMSPTGRLTDRFTPHDCGQVILDGGEGHLSAEGFSDFPVRLDELQTQPMDHKKVVQWYEDGSGFDGRYRVIDSLDGAGPGVVRGQTTYRERRDFAHLQNAPYQYSPYLFEALMQLVGFSIATTAPTQRQAMIPVEVGEMSFLRKCREGEQITLEARMRMEDEKGFLWDARGIDDQGRTVMQVHGLCMQKVTE